MMGAGLQNLIVLRVLQRQRLAGNRHILILPEARSANVAINWTSDYGRRKWSRADHRRLGA